MWPNPQEAADLVTFTEESLNGKVHFLRSVKKWEDDSNRTKYTTRFYTFSEKKRPTNL